jgi:thiamine kinase-like enzyme
MALIPQISHKINKTLKTLNLKPIISPQEFIQKTAKKKHRYWSLCQTKDGKKVIFYARLHQNKDAEIKFKKEIKFLKKIKERNFAFSRYMPKLIKAGLEKDFEWMIREYTDGLPLGFSRKLKIRIHLGMAPILAKVVFQINQFKKEFLGGLGLKKFDWRDYLGVKNLYFGLLKEGVINFRTYQEITRILEEKGEILKKENHYFNHGDLNLGNLIFSKKSFKIIDWELIHLNNFAYDIAYLWTHLWQAPKRFRKKLVSGYLRMLSPKKRKIFKEIFPVVVLYLILGGINYKERTGLKSFFIKRRKFYLNLLPRVLRGFDELIKG